MERMTIKKKMATASEISATSEISRKETDQIKMKKEMIGEDLKKLKNLKEQIPKKNQAVLLLPKTVVNQIINRIRIKMALMISGLGRMAQIQMSQLKSNKRSQIMKRMIKRLEKRKRLKRIKIKC